MQHLDHLSSKGVISGGWTNGCSGQNAKFVSEFAVYFQLGNIQYIFREWQGGSAKSFLRGCSYEKCNGGHLWQNFRVCSKQPKEEKCHKIRAASQYTHTWHINFGRHHCTLQCSLNTQTMGTDTTGVYAIAMQRNSSHYRQHWSSLCWTALHLAFNGWCIICRVYFCTYMHTIKYTNTVNNQWIKICNNGLLHYAVCSGVS